MAAGIPRAPLAGVFQPSPVLIRCVGQCRPRLRLNEDFVSGESKVHLESLSNAWLAGVLLLATPVFAGTILPDTGFGSTGLTGWNLPGPCQIAIDNSGLPPCSGVGQSTSFLGGPSSDGEDQFFAAGSGGFYGSTIFPGWGFTDPQNQDPPPPGMGGNYFLPSGTLPGLGEPGDAAESAPEPATWLLITAGLVAAGLSGRKLARQPVASGKQDSIR